MLRNRDILPWNTGEVNPRALSCETPGEFRGTQPRRLLVLSFFKCGFSQAGATPDTGFEGGHPIDNLLCGRQSPDTRVALSVEVALLGSTRRLSDISWEFIAAFAARDSRSPLELRHLRANVHAQTSSFILQHSPAETHLQRKPSKRGQHSIRVVLFFCSLEGVSTF